MSVVSQSEPRSITLAARNQRARTPLHSEPRQLWSGVELRYRTVYVLLNWFRLFVTVNFPSLETDALIQDT